jgi:hypothetical protein
MSNYQTETNRESSAHVSPRGLVLHSAEERSTGFIERECYFYATAKHFAATPETRDIIIPLLVAGWGDVGAIRETLRRAYGVESWRLYETGTGAPKEKDSAGVWEARVPSGGLQECISAPDPITLHGKIRDRVQAEGKSVEVFGIAPEPKPKLEPAPEPITRIFRVADISSTSNSFGLTGVILVAHDGAAYEVAVSGHTLSGIKFLNEYEITTEGDRLVYVPFSYELPRSLSPVPPAPVAEIWDK